MSKRRKRHSGEQIVRKLREAEAMLAAGQSLGQAFCGFDVMQHEAPLHPTSLVKWRQRVGAERLTLLLEETIALTCPQGRYQLSS